MAHGQERAPHLLGRCQVVLEPPSASDGPKLISENPSRSAKVGVSVTEVYNSDIFDLLSKDGRTAVPCVRPEVPTTREGGKEVWPLTCL